MFFKFFSPLFGRAHRNKLRAYIRGFAILKNADQFGLIRRIGADLSGARFSAVDRSASKSVFGAGHLNAERITRQYLLQRHAGATLNKAILYSLARKSTGVVYPLPGVWQDVLIKHGVAVDQRRSTLAWAIRVFLYWGYGLTTTAKLAAVSLWESRKLNVVPSYRYAYLEGLTPANLPQSGKDGRSHDICTWYAHWEDRISELDALCHDVGNGEVTVVDGLRVEYFGRPYRPLTNFLSAICFIAWGLKAISLSAFDALRGRWWHALILAEAAKAKVVQLSEPGALAADYLFHYSGAIYRPLWTYEADKKGARILCYFYSTSEQAKLPGGYESQRYEWGAATWPIYLVWDAYQADLIRRDTDGDATIKIVGPIWFTASPIEPPVFPERSVAVFDVQPHRRSAHFGFSTLAEYVASDPYLHIQFLQDIHAVFSECAVTMVYKGKRNIGNRGVKNYLNLIQRLSHSPGVISIDPNTSPIRVIEGCKGVISMPFTSTALYFRAQGIPSVYYDPSGWIQKDDRGAHGLPILSGIDELRTWVVSVFKAT